MLLMYLRHLLLKKTFKASSNTQTFLSSWAKVFEPRIYHFISHNAISEIPLLIGNSVSKPDHVDYEIYLFIFYLRIGVDGKISAFRNRGREARLGRTVATHFCKVEGTCRGIFMGSLTWPFLQP